jgi:hypothetical protein
MFSAERCVHRVIDAGGVLAFALGMMCCGGLLIAAHSQSGKPTASLTYQLYSWQDASSGWRFCVLHDTNRQKAISEVFDPNATLKGLDQLRRTLSSMPGGSRLVWFDRLTVGGVKVKGSESLKYPPREVISEVRKWAQRRNIEILGPGAD